MRSSPSEREGDAVLDRELCPLMQYEPRRTLIFREGTVVTYIKRCQVVDLGGDLI